ncbi:MAG: serine protease, partial [Chloroflexi bacterium]|nr:serine protease [Chloroflexota bacterium]
MEFTSPAEQLFFSTVRIEAETPDGRRVGTGSLFSYPQDKQQFLFVVTNKHVIKSA